MRWFKHYSNAKHSEKLMELEEKHGLEGYARYWKLLEFLSERFDGKSIKFKVPTRLLRECMRFKSAKKLRQFSDETLIKLGCNLVENGNVYEIEAPILLELQAKDFKKSRQSCGKVAPKNKDIRYKNKIQEVPNGTSSAELAEPLARPVSRGCIAELSGEEDCVVALEQVSHTSQGGWLKLYEQEFVVREIIRAVDWLRNNPRKAPRDWRRPRSPSQGPSRGLAQFFGGWLSRGWESHRKSHPSVPLGQPRGSPKTFAERRAENRRALLLDLPPEGGGETGVERVPKVLGFSG